MQLVERIGRTHETLMVLEGPGPRASQHWGDYRELGPVLSEQHSTALYMADQAYRRGEINKRFDTDVPHELLSMFVINAATILRKLDKDIQLIIKMGGNDAIVYLKTLSTLRENLTGTITHFQRLVGT